MITTITMNTVIDRTLEVDQFEVGCVSQARLIARQPAGKGVNISRCLAAFGIPSRALGFVGEAELDFYKESFANLPVTVDMITVGPSTRQSTTIIDPEKKTETHLREEGYSVTVRHMEELGKKLACGGKGLKRKSGTDDMVVLAGSLPKGVFATRFKQFCRKVRLSGAKVVVDTNGPALTAAVRARPFMIKPNRVELEALVGERLASQKAIAKAALGLLDRVSVVVVSLGGDGAMYIYKEGVWTASVAIPQQEVRNTVGCGDALLAGILQAVQKGDGPELQLRWGVACGTAAGMDTSAGQLDITTARKIANRVVVRKIEHFGK